jgi:hypothetical protein
MRPVIAHHPLQRPESRLQRPETRDHREEESITTLAHVARGVTEKKWYEHLNWVRERAVGSDTTSFGKNNERSPSGPTSWKLDRPRTINAGGVAAARRKPATSLFSAAGRKQRNIGNYST